MAIRVPRPLSFYYEIAPPHVRLVVCIPREELERRVGSDGVRDTILEHYPDGLDFQVCAYEQRYFREEYGLDLSLDEEALRAALRAAQGRARAENRRFASTGFLRAPQLESFAERLKGKLPPREPDLKRKVLPGSYFQAQRVQQHRREVFLEDPQIEGLEEFGVEALVAGADEMTDGEDAAEVFLRVQQRFMKGGA